jgi:hypothetical protein
LTNRLVFTSLALCVALITISCATIVKKPEVNAVRTVGIASLYASEDVIYKHGSGKFSGWSKETKERVAKMAHGAYETELKRLGWQVVPYQKVLASKTYKTEFGTTNVAGEKSLLEKGVALVNAIQHTKYFTLPGMMAIDWTREMENRNTASFDLSTFSVSQTKTLPQKLEALANELGVDAVVLLEMDYCYGEGTAVLGNGEAYMLAQSAMLAVDKRGVEVVKIPRWQDRCNTEKFGGKSAKSTTIVGKNLFLGEAFGADKLVGMFQQATAASAHKVVGELDKAINAQ